jgi:hypothetical protein
MVGVFEDVQGWSARGIAPVPGTAKTRAWIVQVAGRHGLIVVIDDS